VFYRRTTLKKAGNLHQTLQAITATQATGNGPLAIRCLKEEAIKMCLASIQ
jgi:hypothetical protein